MHVALNKRAEEERAVPDGVVRENDDWVYSEFAETPELKGIDLDQAPVPAPEGAEQAPGSNAVVAGADPAAATHPLAQPAAAGAPVRPLPAPPAARTLPAPDAPVRTLPPPPDAPVAARPAVRVNTP
jgi:penicillin-binding protein 1A